MDSLILFCICQNTRDDFFTAAHAQKTAILVNITTFDAYLHLDWSAVLLGLQGQTVSAAWTKGFWHLKTLAA